MVFGLFLSLKAHDARRTKVIEAIMNPNMKMFADFNIAHIQMDTPSIASDVKKLRKLNAVNIRNTH